MYQFLSHDKRSLSVVKTPLLPTCGGTRNNRTQPSPGWMAIPTYSSSLITYGSERREEPVARCGMISVLSSLISLCDIPRGPKRRLLPPRQVAKSFKKKRLVGRGGGHRNKVVLRLRKLLIFRSARFAQIRKFAEEERYTPGTPPPVISTNCAQIEATVMLSPPLLLGLAPIRGFQILLLEQHSSEGEQTRETTVWDHSSHSAKSCLAGPMPVSTTTCVVRRCGHCWFTLRQAFGITLSLGLLTD